LKKNFGITLPNVYQPFLNFVEPVVFINENGDFEQNYKNITEGDKLYIYAILDQNETPWHLAAVIVTKENKHLSFGMGYLGDYTKSEYLPESKSYFEWLTKRIFKQVAALYTPDYLFINQVMRQLTKPKGQFVKLIASTDLTQDYVRYLYDEFDKLKKEDIRLQVDFFELPLATTVVNSAVARGNTTKLRNSIVDEIHLYEKKVKKFKDPKDLELFENQYQLLKNYLDKLNAGIIPVAFLYNLITIQDRTYCKYTNKGTGKSANCTSFLQKIFSGLLNCSLYDSKFLGLGNSDMLVTHPKLCRQSPEVPVSNCIERQILKPASRRLTVRSRAPMQTDADASMLVRTKRNYEENEPDGKLAKVQFLFRDTQKTKKMCENYLKSLSSKQKLKLLVRDEKHLNELIRQIKNL
jgi:hypothetical protein